MRGQDCSIPDVASLKNHFYREQRLTEEQVLWILEKGTEVLGLQVDAPITGVTENYCLTMKGCSLETSWPICG
jgi:hypothetical protein